MRRSASLVMPLALIFVMLGARPLHAAVQKAPLCFNNSGIADCLDGRFKAFWLENGGLTVFGYPKTPEQPEVNPDDGQTYQTQWLERNRFELHPENSAPYDVLLGRLGVDALVKQGRDWTTFPKADAAAAHYFKETGHAIASNFWPYWSGHGLEFDGKRGKSFAESLALFGMPISEAQMEANPTDGNTYLTQWFERARFEYHPNNPPEYQVLLGLLGNELRGNPSPVAAPPSPPVAAKQCDPSSAIELLTNPWHFEGENRDAQAYQPLKRNVLQGKTLLKITYDLHGSTFHEGERKDESAIIIDQPVEQPVWHVASVSNYGKNGVDGTQEIYIPLTDFRTLPDAGNIPLNPDAPVREIHARFWNANHFVVDIMSIVACKAAQ